jgi:hypothetical protein
MQQAELYVNDILLDMPNDSLIALSYAVNSLTDLKSVQGNISNAISLPDTANNRAALGYPDDINFNGASLIRRKLPCRYVQNGVDVIPQGNLRIVGSSKGSLKIVISSGNTDFFDLITGKLPDLDMGEYDHFWTQENVISTRTNTTGFVYPIINYGNLANNDGSIYSSVINPKQMRPAVFAKYIVKKIVESAGYNFINKIDDDPVTQPLFDNLLLPFSIDKFAHSQRFIKQNQPNDLEVQLLTQPSPFDDPGGSGTDRWLGFDHIVSDNLHTFDGSHFTAPELMSVNIDFAFEKIISTSTHHAHLDGAYFELWTNAGGGNHVITRSQTRINENDYVSTGIFSGRYETVYTNFHVSASNVVLKAGEQIWMNVGSLYGCTQTIIPKVTLTVKRNFSDMVYGEKVQIESVLPDMTCTDFLKFISFLFCAVFQTDNINKTVTAVPFGYILQNLPIAVEWSDKVTNDGEDYDVQIGDYCQQNEAKYLHDDTVSPDTYGNGSFTLIDENLDLYQDIYDIPFAASFEQPVLGDLRTLFINKIPDRLADTMSTHTEPRICVLNPINATINYQANGGDTPQQVNTAIPLAYFTGINGSPGLTMPYIFSKHYIDLVNVLNDQRKLTCYLGLNEIDIQTLDFFKPVYISKYASYFYISKITDFTGVKPCKVELIKLL